MCIEWNRVAGVCGHRTMNLPVSVIGTGLWALCEPLRCHVLNILRPYIPWDEWRFELPSNRHLIPAFKTVTFRIYFCFFLCHTKNHATYFHSNKLEFKKTIILFSMLPSCHVIFPYPHNIVVRIIPLKFVMCINNSFKIKIVQDIKL